MGHLRERQVLAEFGEVLENGDDAPVIDLEKGLQRQDREELVLGEVLAAAHRRVRRQGFLSQAQRLLGHRARRFGHRSWGLHNTLETGTRPKDSTEHFRGCGNSNRGWNNPLQMSD